MSDDSGELFIKPCTASEVEFYESAHRDDTHSRFAELMPVFMGTLSLSDPSTVSIADDAAALVAGDGEVSAAKEEIRAVVAEAVANGPQSAAAQTGAASPWAPKAVPKKIETDRAIVLGSTSHGFKRPNILDAKLGRRLWADDAPQAKKDRFDKIAEETTHQNLGFRIAGMRVFRGSDTPSELDDDEYKVYGKDYGRKDVNDDNVVSEFRKFVFNKSAGIDEDHAKAVCKAFVHDLENVEDVLAHEESRMYSSSLLFVFEGDGAALKSAIERNNAVAEVAEEIAEKAEKEIRLLDHRMDSGIHLEEDAVGFDLSSLPQIYSLKLIDFAHAEWTPGQGPDENVLLGVRSLKDIFEKMATENPE